MQFLSHYADKLARAIWDLTKSGPGMVVEMVKTTAWSNVII